MTLQGDALTDAIGRTRDKWGWFVALGVLVLIFGGIAFGNLFIATVASVYVVGWLMLMAGVIEIIHGLGLEDAFQHGTLHRGAARDGKRQ